MAPALRETTRELLLQLRATLQTLDSPKDEIGMGHEVGDALKHAPGLENERRERHFVKVHADS